MKMRNILMIMVNFFMIIGRSYNYIKFKMNFFKKFLDSIRYFWGWDDVGIWCRSGLYNFKCDFV